MTAPLLLAWLCAAFAIELAVGVTWVVVRRKRRIDAEAAVTAAPPEASAALAAVVGDKPLPRTEVTKKVWEYIKKHDLQDKAKKTLINADAKLKAVVESAQVSMFELTKKISQHLK